MFVLSLQHTIQYYENVESTYNLNHNRHPNSTLDHSLGSSSGHFELANRTFVSALYYPGSGSSAGNRGRPFFDTAVEGVVEQ